MGKAKAAAAEKTAAEEPVGEPAVILFGRDEKGRSHASWFTSAETELAERAAALMAMAVLPVSSDEHRAAASELPAGKIFASGKGFVPFCAEGTYTRLETLPGAYQPTLPAEAEPPAHSSIPSTWAEIDVGALVLAAELPRGGFYEAVIMEAPGDDMFELRWLSWPNLPPFVRRREHLGLIAEAAFVSAEGLSEALAAGAEAPSAES